MLYRMDIIIMTKVEKKLTIKIKRMDAKKVVKKEKKSNSTNSLNLNGKEMKLWNSFFILSSHTQTDINRSSYTQDNQKRKTMKNSRFISIIR